MKTRFLAGLAGITLLAGSLGATGLAMVFSAAMPATIQADPPYNPYGPPSQPPRPYVYWNGEEWVWSDTGEPYNPYSPNGR